MTVYIDNARIRHGNIRVCHMYGDDLKHLHAMAQEMGLAWAHFQSNTPTPHYVVNVVKRPLAIECGAKSLVTRQQVIDTLAKLRNAAGV